MISLGKFSGSCNAASDLSSKIYVPSKTKNANVKITNIIKNRNEAKILVKHISCDLTVKRVIQIKNGIMLNANVGVKIIIRAKVIKVGILIRVFVIIASI